ncbi:MAG: hypothetical protein COC15_04265 [Legionellales bacterium]|nr:MAG: hypothetical protein COC15_04265 [Legionellales bacterium]
MLYISLLLSILLHGLVIFYLGFNYDGPANRTSNNAKIPKPVIIKASLVNKAAVDKEVKYLLQQERQRQQQQRRNKQTLIKKQQQLAIKKQKLDQIQKEILIAKQQLSKEREQAQQQALRQQQHAQQQQQREMHAAINLAVDQAKASFKKQVQQHWLRPYGLAQNLQCCFDIHLDPTGKIIAISIVDSSGNTAFDALAQKAIEHASPLHSLPTNKIALQKLQNFRFIFES